MSRFLKYFAVVAGVFILLSAAGTVFFSSQFFKDWVRGFLTATAKKYVRGEISVGAVQGNLFRHLELSEVLIKSRGDTVLFVPRISLHYQTRPLLRRQVVLDSIRIDSLYAVARQLTDSTWNFSGLFVTDTSALQWVVRGEQTELRGSRLAIRPLTASPLLPKLIENLEARFSWLYADSMQDLHVRQFKLRSRSPDLVLNELTFQLTHRRNELQLRDLTIRTRHNRFDGSGALYAARRDHAASPRKATAKLSSDPLHLEEFNFALPFLRIHGNPDFDVSTRLRGDSLRFRLAIREHEQHLQLEGHLAQWQQEPRYAVAGTISNFDASTWLQQQQWACLINGKFDFAGRGFSPRAMAVDGNAELQDCILFRQKIQRISWRGQYRAGSLQSRLQVSGDLGEAAVEAVLGDSLHAQNFQVRAHLKRLLIPPLAVADTLRTVLNLALTARGRGLHPDTAQARVQLAFGPSLFAGAPIDTLWGQGEIHHKRIKIDTLHVLSPLGDFHLGGSFNRASSWALRFDGHVHDVQKLRPLGLVAADTLSAAGKFAGEIRGLGDSLKAQSEFALQHLRFDDLAVDTLNGNIFLHRQNGRWWGQTRVHGENAHRADLPLDNRFDLRASFVDSSFNINMDFAQGDSLDGRLNAVVVFTDSLHHVALTHLEFRFKNQAWASTQDTVRLTIGENFYRLQDLHLVSGKQVIHAEGVWDFNRELDLRCKVDSIDVRAWSEVFKTPVPLTGSLHAGVRVLGTAQTPILDGEFAIEEGRIDRLPYENLQARFHYRNENLSWQASLKSKTSSEIVCSGFLPLNLSFTSAGKTLMPDDSMRMTLSIPAFDLSALKIQFPDVQEAGGKLEARLTIANTPAHPSVQGAVSLREGTLEIPRYGVRFTGIELNAAMDDHRINLNELTLKRDRGVLAASGHAEYEKDGMGARITGTQIKIKANNLLLTNHRALELLVEGEAELAGDFQQPRFQGAMKVVRARVDLPAFSEAYKEYEAKAQAVTPMLVAAMAGKDSAAERALAPEPWRESSATYRNLRGNLKVEILRNTWLRSPALNVEISGEVNVAKNGPDLEVFGPIQVERGTYVLPGISKSFEVESGTIIFQGGADYNPELDLYADYVFRRPEGKRTLRAHITGKAASPDFAFTLVEEDNKEVTENDALAYLIFGQSMEELTQGANGDNTNGSPSTSNTAAREAVSGMLSDQLSRRLGQELGVDVLRVRGNQNFEELSFLVGKYITNDLFVSYEDELGGRNDSNQQAYSTITLEYEVARFLFLQLVKGDLKATGFDAIIKIQK